MSSTSSGELTKLTRLPMDITLSNALVTFLLTPIRRIRLLQTVEGDLMDDGVLPRDKGFGGLLGCGRFLYRLGGLRALYCGATLEAAMCLLKYEVQRYFVIPAMHCVPLGMRDAYVSMTILHTLLIFVPLAPLQAYVEMIAANAVTELVEVEGEEGMAEQEEWSPTLLNANSPKINTPLSENPPDAADGNPMGSPPESPPCRPKKMRLRFDGMLSAMRACHAVVPVWYPMRQFASLDFVGRLLTSFMHNKLLGFLYVYMVQHSGTLDGFSALIFWHILPLSLSIAGSAITYPFSYFPLTHFLRVSHHERAVQVAAMREEEDEAYPLNNSYIGGCRSCSSFAAVHSHSHASHSELDSVLYIDLLIFAACPEDVRSYLSEAVNDYGVRGVYRGFSAQLAATLASSILGMSFAWVRRRLWPSVLEYQ